MKYVILFSLLTCSLLMNSGAIQPPDRPEDTVPDIEKKIPPGHYCVTRQVYDYNHQRSSKPRNSGGFVTERAHPCDCKMSCTTDEDGNVTEHEDNTCQAYCHVNGRYCTCHTEEPCDPHGNALMNMDGQVVAVIR